MFRPFALAALVACMVAPSAPVPAAPITVDGVLDAAYGAPLSTQTTQTINDNSNAQIDVSYGSELDQAYGAIADGTLYVFLSGNLHFEWTIEGTTLWLPLDLFVDTGAGGQNVLLPNNPNFSPTYDLGQMAGLKFDDGFSAGWWLSIGGDLYSWPRLSAYFAALPAGGGGSGLFLGTTLCGGNGTLSGGTNPFGVQVAVIDSNTVGVTSGCGPALGTGVRTGIEWAIPLAAIGNPSGCIKICAMDACGNHSCILNQTLGPLPPGTCATMPTGSVDFAAIPGQQFFTVCANSTPARAASWGALKLRYR